MNKTKIKLLLMKNPALTKEIWIFTSMAWALLYDSISSYNNFSAKNKNVFKNQPYSSWYPVSLRKNISNIQSTNWR